MFDFFDMMGNYEDRVVDRTEFSWGFVSTAKVTDGSHPYETAVKSDEYGKADSLEETDAMIIVEAYDSKEAAQIGHDKWCKKMGERPPKELVDCCNSGISELGTSFGIKSKEIRLSTV